MLHLRYPGTDTALIVPYGPPDQVVPMFTAAHRARFGFATPERPLIVEALAVEATTAGEPVRETRAAPRVGRGPDAGGPGRRSGPPAPSISRRCSIARICEQATVSPDRR